MIWQKKELFFSEAGADKTKWNGRSDPVNIYTDSYHASMFVITHSHIH